MAQNKDLDLYINKLYSEVETRLRKYDEIFFDNLPKYTPWVRKILGLEPVIKRVKSKSEILREFEEETYKVLYEKFNSKSWDSFFEYRDFVRKEESSHPKFFNNSYYLVPEEVYTAIHAEFISDLLKYFLPVQKIVEIGAGYGGVLLGIASREEFSSSNCIGTDISTSGAKLLSELAGRFNLKAKGIVHDFNDYESLNFISQGDIVYTNHSLMYVPEIKKSFFEDIIERRPKAVINVEPVYPENNTARFSDLMVERYITINGYNRNLDKIILGLVGEGKIEILYHSGPVLGHHPFLPVSVIIWRPVS